MDAVEMDRRMIDFRKTYCKRKHQGSPRLSFVSDMYYCLGVTPRVTLTKVPRAMVLTDIVPPEGGYK